MGQKIWRHWRHGPRTAIFQNSGGGGGWGVSHTRTGPGRPPRGLRRKCCLVQALVSRQSPPTKRHLREFSGSGIRAFQCHHVPRLSAVANMTRRWGEPNLKPEDAVGTELWRGVEGRNADLGAWPWGGCGWGAGCWAVCGRGVEVCAIALPARQAAWLFGGGGGGGGWMWECMWGRGSLFPSRVPPGWEKWKKMPQQSKRLPQCNASSVPPGEKWNTCTKKSSVRVFHVCGKMFCNFKKKSEHLKKNRIVIF